MLDQNAEAKPRLALVTGASGGLGSAIVRALAAEGISIALHYRNHEAAARALADEARSPAARVELFRADISNHVELVTMFDSIEKTMGRLSIVVANAAVPHRAALADVTEADFDRVFATNARATFFTLQEGARRVRDGGRLIAISSSQVLYPAADFALYAGSKASVGTFVRSVALDVGKRGVTANALVVGPVDAGFLRDAPDDYKTGMAANAALGRFATPQEVAASVAFLASTGAAAITGQQIVVDGGATQF